MSVWCGAVHTGAQQVHLRGNGEDTLGRSFQCRAGLSPTLLPLPKGLFWRLVLEKLLGSLRPSE